MLFSLSVNGNNREVKCYLESDNWIVQNLNNALETWNSKLSEIWQLLTQSPETFKGGDIWSVMLTIHDALKGIGYGLLVLFFAISVVKTCSSYLDVKKPEHPQRLYQGSADFKGLIPTADAAGRARSKSSCLISRIIYQWKSEHVCA